MPWEVTVKISGLQDHQEPRYGRFKKLTLKLGFLKGTLTLYQSVDGAAGVVEVDGVELPEGLAAAEDKGVDDCSSAF